MKLIVQIPAYNEHNSIQEVIKSIPKKVQGIDKLEILVIDDGSTDKTSEAAKQAGATYVLRNTKNQGLAYTFQRGLNFALSKGADIIVNTDADNQYNQSEISKLIAPIIAKQADIVSGDRKVETLKHMVSAKKYGNIIGSKVVKFCAGYHIKDASSGFRAYNKEAALKLLVLSKHTYTHETLIQAAHKNLKVIEVPVEFKKRPDTNHQSKLISSVPNHIKKSLITILRNTLMYNSLRTFVYLGFILTLVGAVPFLRWLYLSILDGHFGMHTQSLLVGLLFLMFGGFAMLAGLLSDIIATNRRHLEELMYEVKSLKYN